MSKNKNMNLSELPPREREEEKARRKRVARLRGFGRFINRILGILVVTGIVFGCAGLALEYVLLKGPSPALRETFAMTMFETRRFTWMPNIFLTEDEVAELRSARNGHVEEDFDASLITIAPKEPVEDPNGDDSQALNAYGDIDEDGDGIILTEVSGSTYVGYMITLLDSSRLFVGMPDGYGGMGLTLEEMCQKYGARGGINAGGFADKDGTGSGGLPDGLTIVDGVCYNEGGEMGHAFVGIGEDGILHIGYYTYEDAVNMGIRDGISFGPVLIYNGKAQDISKIPSGLNPRTAIGQRADGAVLMLVIDGRQVHSLGATYQDVIDIMLSFGAINACNLDGGSSTTMWMDGDYVNSCSSENGRGRPLPDAFLFS